MTILLHKCKTCGDSIRTRQVDVYRNNEPIHICRPCLMKFIGHAQDAQTVMIVAALKFDEGEE